MQGAIVGEVMGENGMYVRFLLLLYILSLLRLVLLFRMEQYWITALPGSSQILLILIIAIQVQYKKEESTNHLKHFLYYFFPTAS
jgi:hypothetical protein